MKQWEEIKDKLSIVDVVSAYVPLQKAGRNYKATCPFHSEQTPSFMVSPELQIYKCFGCGDGGDVFEFIKKIEGVEFSEALKILADKAGVELKEYKKDPQAKVNDRVLEINNTAAAVYKFFLHKHKVGEEARKYLSERGLSSEVIREFGLGYAPKSWDTVGKYLLSRNFTFGDLSVSGLIVKKDNKRFFDFFRGRVLIPLKDIRGQVVGFSGRRLDPKDIPKYLNTTETSVFHKGEFLFGLYNTRHEIKKQGWALVVEGDFGLLTLYDRKVKNVVALKGTAFTNKQLALIGRYTKKLVLYLDSDEAGTQAALKNAFAAQENGFSVKVIAGPKGKDPDDLIKEDPEKFHKLLASPQDVYDFVINTYREQYDLRSGSEKREFSHKVLAVLAQIKDPVERQHYVKKLGLILETDETLLTGLIEQFLKNNRLQPSLNQSLPKPTVSVRPRLSKEQYFLALLFKSPLEIAQKRIHLAGKNDFADKLNLEIFEIYKEHITDRKSELNPQSFRRKLEKECQELFDTLYLTDLSYLDSSFDTWEVETEQVLKELKAMAIKRELKEVSFAIKRAEQEGGEVDGLQQKFNELRERL